MLTYINFLSDNNPIIDFIKMTIIIIATYNYAIKILDKSFTVKNALLYIIIGIISFIAILIKYKVNYLYCILFLVIINPYFFMYILKSNYFNSMLIFIIALGTNYVFFIFTSAVMFIPTIVFKIKNEYISLLLILIIFIFLIKYICKIKKIRRGIVFLKNYKDNEYYEIMTLICSSIIVFLIVMIDNYDKNEIDKIGISVFIISFIMFLTIKKSIEAYYKQKLLIQDLNETKKELEEKKKEVEELEAENLNFSKKSHSLAHKQKSLEFKINKLLMNSENAKELGIENELKNLSKELYENSKLPQLEKTGITEIDDMLCVMQEECRMNGIDFSLQLKGNIYQMTNNYVTKEELSILLADHIKDAIIAINHTDTINKSIMVRLGKIDENFGLYIYDSGVEFPKEVLENLGKKPITTYHNEGGTGMGFMNTFDTLNKHNASLIIESIGKPSKDNYTKVIKIIFDGKNDRIYK